MSGGSFGDRDAEVDIATAVSAFPWIDGVYVLDLSSLAEAHPDRLTIAVVMKPYGIEELVQTHYAVLASTGTYEATGRILYVNGAGALPTPMHRARRIVLGPKEREAAHRRIAQRKREAAAAVDSELERARLRELEASFRRIVEQAARDAPETHPVTGGSPYRPPARPRPRPQGPPGEPLDQLAQDALQRRVDQVFDRFAIAARFGPSGRLEVVADPFPPRRRRRVLVVDEDPTTAAALGELRRVDVVSVRDAWTAIDRMAEESFDLVLCALVLGETSGATFHRMVRNAQPTLARRIVFLAHPTVASQAPPSSAGDRVLARPVDPRAVMAALRRFEERAG